MVEGVKFATAEDALIWASMCQLARDEGSGGGAQSVERGCEVNYIWAVTKRLYSDRRCRLGGEHIKAIRLYGAGDCNPELRRRYERYWDEAVQDHEEPLRLKGIIE